MLFGAHVSAQGGVFNAPKNAAHLGCECFQFFSRPPQGGPAPKLTPEVIKKFKSECQKYNFKDFYIHTPYLINLASKSNRIKYNSIKIIREDLERGSKLGVKYVMTHLGSAKDIGRKKALDEVVKGILKILADYQGKTEFLIEDSAGAGQIIGDDFDELGKILKGVKKKLPQAKIGICLDTCHSFASGYDWRDKKAIDKTLKEFDKHIGLKYLKLLHLNDSLTELDSHRDRHAHLGKGKIGARGFQEIVEHPKLKKLNAVLETPTEAGRKQDLKLLKKSRSN